MKKMIFIPLLCSLFCACKNDTKNLEGNWQLIFFQKENVAQELCVTSLKITSDSKNTILVSGFSGINNFSTSYNFTDSEFKLQNDLITTRMAGPKNAMEFEKNFLEGLSNANTIYIEKTEGTKYLIIKSNDNKYLLRFAPISIMNKKWNLISYFDGTNLVPVFSNKSLENIQTPNINFNKNNRVNGFSGANNFNLEYKLNKEFNSISIIPGVITLIETNIPEISVLESTFMSLLHQTTSYDFSGNQLILKNNKEETILIFQFQALVK